MEITTFIKPVKVVSVAATLDILEVGQSTKILFTDAKPTTIASQACRFKSKSFTVTVKGQNSSTLVTRQK